MVKPKTRAFLIVGGLVVLLIGLLATATMVRTVLAQTATPGATTPSDGDTDIPALPFGRSGRLGGFGHSGSRDGGDEYLAEALGITVEELQAARETAYAAYLADAVAAGEITQAQADELLARQRLSSYIDHEALVAEALGLSVDELEAALAGGQSLSDLMTAQGLTAETLQTALQTAYEAAIARAVADGVITQAQADAYLSASPNFGLFGGHHGFGGGRGGHGHGGGFSRPDDTDPDTTTPETTDTGFGA
ncbi:MAG: hypothetical protein KIT52_18945 [Anaerolineae bacterium]|nr:hypothetical protein [Anaerolineae bacterium]